MSGYIRLVHGVPTLKDFKSDEGTPLVIDTATGTGYYLDHNLVYPLRADGILPVAAAYNNGFNTGFS